MHKRKTQPAEPLVQLLSGCDVRSLVLYDADAVCRAQLRAVNTILRELMDGDRRRTGPRVTAADVRSGIHVQVLRSLIQHGAVGIRWAKDPRVSHSQLKLLAERASCAVSISLCAGVFALGREPLRLTSEELTLRSSAGSSIVLDEAAEGRYTSAIHVEAAAVTLKDLQISSVRVMRAGAARIEDSKLGATLVEAGAHAYLSKCQVESASDGVKVSGTLQLVKSSVLNCERHGVAVQPGGSARLTHATLEGNSGCGLSCYGSVLLRKGCVARSNGGAGLIALSNAAQITISKNGCVSEGNGHAGDGGDYSQTRGGEIVWEQQAEEEHVHWS